MDAPSVPIGESEPSAGTEINAAEAEHYAHMEAQLFSEQSM